MESTDINEALRVEECVSDRCRNRRRRRLRLALLPVSVAALVFVTTSHGSVGQTTRISLTSQGAQAVSGDSSLPSVSNDGRYIAFNSSAVNLVSGDTNAAMDIFVRDTISNATSRVSVSTAGAQATATSMFPAVSGDGRYVAFTSYAGNLVSGDTNSTYDIFVHDRAITATARVSVSSGGAQGASNSYEPSVSADGRYVAFESEAGNLVAGDTNGSWDVFLRDTTSGTTTRESVSGTGAQATGGDSTGASISSDGRYVAFGSAATNLVTGDTNGVSDVFVRDRDSGSTTRLSVDTSGAQASGGDSSAPAISGDGRYVAFGSSAVNLVAGDTNGVADIFVHDRMTGSTTRVSTDNLGAQAAGGASQGAAITSDGRYVAFDSHATNLVPGDTNIARDVFVRDTAAATTTRVDVDSSGAQSTIFGSWSPSMSSDGRYVAFTSGAANLVEGDTNDVLDAFVHQYLADAVSPTVPDQGARPPGQDDLPKSPEPAGSADRPGITGQRMNPECVRLPPRVASNRHGNPTRDAAKSKKKKKKSRLSLAFDLSQDAAVKYEVLKLKTAKASKPITCKSTEPESPTWRTMRTFSDDHTVGHIERTDISKKIVGTAKKALEPGSYRTRLTAENSIGRSETVHADFKVLRRR